MRVFKIKDRPYSSELETLSEFKKYAPACVLYYVNKTIVYIEKKDDDLFNITIIYTNPAIREILLSCAIGNEKKITYYECKEDILEKEEVFNVVSEFLIEFI